MSPLEILGFIEAGLDDGQDEESIAATLAGEGVTMADMVKAAIEAGGQ